MRRGRAPLSIPATYPENPMEHCLKHQCYNRIEIKAIRGSSRCYEPQVGSHGVHMFHQSHPSDVEGLRYNVDCTVTTMMNWNGDYFKDANDWFIQSLPIRISIAKRGTIEGQHSRTLYMQWDKMKPERVGHAFALFSSGFLVMILSSLCLHTRIMDLEEGSGSEACDKILLGEDCDTELPLQEQWNGVSFLDSKHNGQFETVCPMTKNRWASIIYRRGQKQLAHLFLREAEHALKLSLSEE
eukprot:Gb_11487 [translate_table: standard]